MRLKGSKKYRRGSQSGFTLIEVAIAVGILAAMAVINYNTIMSFVESKLEIDDQRQSVFVANSVLGRLTRELLLATKDRKLPPPPSNPAGQPQQAVLLGGPSAVGDDGPGIMFSATDAGQHVHNGTTHSGIVTITYRVAPDPDKKGDKDAPLMLVREEILNRPPFDVAYKNAIRFPITSQLVNLEFKFYDQANSQWLPDWTGQQAANLPDIVQFTLSLKSGKGRVTTYTSAVKLNRQ